MSFWRLGDAAAFVITKFDEETYELQYEPDNITVSTYKEAKKYAKEYRKRLRDRGEKVRVFFVDSSVTDKTEPDRWELHPDTLEVVPESSYSAPHRISELRE